ncbi:MAG: hypothetical protein IPL40_00055 [Proteobacteria bacterium]|nr:hypothetical protein [Pseudomonadota bacterium]
MQRRDLRRTRPGAGPPRRASEARRGALAGLLLLGAACHQHRPVPWSKDGREPPPRADARSDRDTSTRDGGQPEGGDSSASTDRKDARAGADGMAGGWVVSHLEDFETGALGTAAWQPDGYPDDGPFADRGSYFTEQGLAPPSAYRLSLPFGEAAWLTLESSTRDATTTLTTLASVVADPSGGSNQVLRLRSPRHTDATVVRPSAPLPARYRVSLRVGHLSFGDGSGANGYSGGERAEPWRDASAQTDNGCYWLAILDSRPRPHNNIWIHHHRKVVIDTDNHLPPPWVEIWNGQSFVASGKHGLTMFAIDGRDRALDADRVEIGKRFVTYAAGQWQREAELDAIRAVDAYRPATWYDVRITRDGGRYTLEVSGDFAYGGRQHYRATLDAATACVWHYNQPGETATSGCLDAASWPAVTGAVWPAGVGWPDYFMFGDPHTNYYEGEVYYDDVRLELPAP